MEVLFSAIGTIAVVGYGVYCVIKYFSK